jgi:anti-sigma B factor antagonist
MELKSRSTTDGKIAILELVGRFDAFEVPPVKEWLKNVSTAPPAQVVVNLSQIHFIDSSGLSSLVQGMKHCRQHEGNLHLCGMQQPVQIIFELTRLDKAFDIFAGEDEAISAFSH